MPIEINELVVRIVVDQPAGRRPPANGGAGRGAEREELVQQCVEAVLDALRAKQER